MEASRHLRTVSHQLQQRYLRLKRVILAGDVLLIAIGVAFLASVGMTLFGWPVSQWVLYGADFGLGAVGLAGAGLARPHRTTCPCSSRPITNWACKSV